MNLKSWPGAPILDSLDAIRFGPGSESTGGNASKVRALGPTCDSFGSIINQVDAFNAEAPGWPGGA